MQTQNVQIRLPTAEKIWSTGQLEICSSQKGAADTPVENMSAMQRGQLAAKEKLERENKRAEVAARGNGERKDGGGSGGSPGPQLEKMSAMQRGLLAAKEKMEREKKRAEAKDKNPNRPVRFSSICWRRMTNMF